VSLPDPIALQRRARDLAHRHPAEVRAALAVDPISVVRDEFGITIVERPRGGRGCDLDASYDEETNTITLDSSAAASRKRFSCLHELAHHDVSLDAELCDWLYQLGKHQSPTLELLCDAYAAEILLDTATVAAALPQRFRARHLYQLVDESTASREACVVRAAQHLAGPGLIVLADDQGVVKFSSARSLAFRVGRGVQQDEQSVITRAAKSGSAVATRERLMLRNGRSYTELSGDAISSDDGYVYAVLRDAGDDVDMRGNSFEARRSWHCPTCDEDITDEDWCNTCNRKVCRTCGCQCGRPRPAAKPRVCPDCHLEIPIAATECPNH
jgi:Zn-dependent peptidase ImmA (M78 family)